MIRLTFKENQLYWNNNNYQIKEATLDGELNANVNLANDQDNFWVLFLANETTINGVLQTSSEMIVETLTS
jgi:hypothetical protein